MNISPHLYSKELRLGWAPGRSDLDRLWCLPRKLRWNWIFDHPQAIRRPFDFCGVFREAALESDARSSTASPKLIGNPGNRAHQPQDVFHWIFFTNFDFPPLLILTSRYAFFQNSSLFIWLNKNFWRIEIFNDGFTIVGKWCHVSWIVCCTFCSTEHFLSHVSILIYITHREAFSR